MARQYFLLKSEPDVYSIDTLARDKRTSWEGVRNYQARNYLRSMRRGDWCLFYHSNAKPPGVVGLCEVVREAYPDPAQFDSASPYFDAQSKPDSPRWDRVDVAFVEKFAQPLPLDQLKAEPRLAELQVCQRGSRLSVHPVSAQHMGVIFRLAKARQQLVG